MSTTARRDQLSRLLQVLFAVRSGHPNADELARLCEVSRRTIYRDIASLELAGVPVRYRTERQGYEIAPSFLLPTPQLSRREAVALAITARLRAADRTFLGRDMQLALGKVLSALPASERLRVEELGRLIEVPEGVGAGGGELGSVSSAVFEALSTRKELRAWYRRGEDQTIRESDVELIGPYRIVLARHGWHMLGAAGLDGRHVLRLGLTSIWRAELTDRPYILPPEADVRRWLVRAGLTRAGRRQGIFVRLRVRGIEANRFPEGVWHPDVRHGDWLDEDQELTLFSASAESVLELARQLGDAIEVLAPPELRRRYLELLRRHRESALARQQALGPARRGIDESTRAPLEFPSHAKGA